MPIPSNLIVGGGTTAAQSVLEIPGLSGSPDILPGSFQFDDEFDQNTAGTPSGWTQFGTPSICNTNDFLSMLHMQHTGTANSIRGIYRALPGGLTYPLNITMKIADFDKDGIAGFLISPVAPGNAGTAAGMSYSSGTQGMTCDMSTLALAGNGNNSNIGYLPSYLRCLMASSTSVAPLYSIGGEVYQAPPASSVQTLAAAAAFLVVFIADTGSLGPGCDAIFDYVRIQ